MKSVAVGNKVIITDYAGKHTAVTHKMGIGYVRTLYKAWGESLVEVYFPKLKVSGGWPVDLVRVI